MNPDDEEAWGQARAAYLRQFQEAAYSEMGSLRWWVRQQYNMLPTDERYLNLTETDLQVEYWLHVLTARKMQAEKDGVIVETLDDLLTGATVEEKMTRIDAELERQAKARQSMPDERETVVHWKADE